MRPSQAQFSLRTRLVLLGVLFPVLLTAVLLYAYAQHAREVAVNAFAAKARAICMTAESARENMEQKWRLGVFTPATLQAWAREGGKAARDKILQAVPVISAIQAASLQAKAGGYQVKVPKLQPRNPANEPDEVERVALRKMEAEHLEEYSFFDEKHNEIRYFRPIRLSRTCLYCHGDGQNTEHNIWGTRDGTDITGAKMEGWREGELHGAFEIRQSLDEAAQMARSNVMNALLLAGGLILLCALAFALIVVFLVERPISRACTALADGAAEVGAASTEVARLSQSLSSGATEQASCLEETSASLATLADSATTNAERAETASGSASHATETARASERKLDEIGQRVKGRLDDLRQAVADIQRATEETTKIVESLDGIAFRTHLLALNASIEAARVGPAGAGFAVVAREVGNLAQRAAEEVQRSGARMQEAKVATTHMTAATQSVDALLADVLEREMPAVFTDLVRSSGQMTELMGSVVSLSKEQAQGVAQINTAVGQLNVVTSTNATGAARSATASEQLSRQAESLQDTVNDLVALVGADLPRGGGAVAQARG